MEPLRILRIAFVLLGVSLLAAGCVVVAPTPSTPTPAAPTAPEIPALQTADLGECPLESGEVILDCQLGYRTAGEMNADRSNVILLLTPFMRKSELVVMREGHLLLDPSKYFIIVVDALGNSVSSSPSNSPQQPGEQFPQFTVKDTVNAEYRLLTDVLGIDHVRAVMGLSYGGYQTFQWMVSYPDFMDKAISGMGTTKSTSFDRLWGLFMLQLIEDSRSIPGGDRLALEGIGAISTLLSFTPSYVLSNIPSESVPQVISTTMQSFLTYDMNDYASQGRAALAFDIAEDFDGSVEKAAAAVHAQTLIFVSMNDHTVNPAPAVEFARLINARLLVFDGDIGHGGMLGKFPELKPQIAAFLEE